MLQTLPPEIWASITPHLSGEHLILLNNTGSKVIQSRLRSPYAVKSIIFGIYRSQQKRWPAVLKDLPTVEKLHLKSKEHDLNMFRLFTLDMAPITLRKLSLGGSVQTNLSSLASSLSSDTSLDGIMPNLESLKLNADWDQSMPVALRNPKNLTYLKVQVWNCCIPLPASLLHLKLNRISPNDDSTCLTFPTRLEKLECQEFWSLAHGLISSLPNTMSLFYIEQSSFDQATFNQIPKGAQHMRVRLNATLCTQLQLGISSLQFPIHLTKLEMAALPHPCWPILPSTLKSLHIHTVRDIPDRECFTEDGHAYSVSLPPLYDLPQSLTHLKLDFQTFCYLVWDEALLDPIISSKYSAENLFPRGLTSLSLTFTHIDDQILQVLPSSLTELALENLGPSGCKCLPRGLTKLSVMNALLEPDFFRFLPTSITSLALRPVLDIAYWPTPNTYRCIMFDNYLSETDFVKRYSTVDVWATNPVLASNIRHLSIHRGEHIGDSYIHKSLQNLVQFNLRSWTTGLKITDLAIASLPRYLSHLDLTKSNLTGKCFADLPRTLTFLRPGSCQVVDSDLQHLPPYLNLLNLEYAHRLTDDCLQYLPKTLEFIDFNPNSLLTAQAMQHAFPWLYFVVPKTLKCNRQV